MISYSKGDVIIGYSKNEIEILNWGSNLFELVELL